MKTLKQISNDCYYKMENYHQITIDFIDDADDIFNNYTPPEGKNEKNEILCKLGNLYYEIDVTLEIFNPILIIEIEDLETIKKIIQEKEKEIKNLVNVKY